MARLDPQSTPSGSSRRNRRSRKLPIPHLAHCIFAVIVVAGPLAFGSVDRLTQIAVVALLAVGVLARPIVIERLSPWGNRLAIALVLLVLAKEFAPAAWFGRTAWRMELTENYSVALPSTHNPEPARALDAMLVGFVALVWFLWVRTLAGVREHREGLTWTMFIAASIVAGVSFATKGIDPDAIYGLRFTPGWTGFGPFPNRNHTATLLAMGAVLGFGCICWAAARRRWGFFSFALAFCGMAIAGLFQTESRGGLLAFVAGVAVFLILLFLRWKNRQVFLLSFAAVLVITGLTVVFGARLLARFSSEDSGHISTATRIEVWKDALGMAADAPLFGHGIGSFAQVFPMYQRLELEEVAVLHPESSWLQWLTELGAVPIALALAALGIFVVPHLQEAFSHRQAFFLRSGAFAGGAVLLLHALIDVPAHRWGTAGYGLALLALACPMHLHRVVPGSRKVAFVLAGIAAFWILPLLIDRPIWSPLSLNRLLAREAAAEDVRSEELERALRYFPLNPALHQSLGMRRLVVNGRDYPATWQSEFAVASRLVPASWMIAATQARAVKQIAPGIAVGYWQQAVERGRLHRDEILQTAVAETASWPPAAAKWSRYVESNPHLLLTYATIAPADQAPDYFALWWQERGRTAPLERTEIELFYEHVAEWGKPKHLDEWMEHRPDLEPRDFRRWALLLQKWGAHERAWNILARHTPEPQFPAGSPNAPRGQLESKWRLAPTNFVNAQQLAQAMYRSGEVAESDAVVLAVAENRGASPPPWFLQRAAYIQAHRGRFDEAVAILLGRR